LNLPALVIGSIAPDFGYYIRRYALSDLAHTWHGVVLADVPTGLLVLSIFYLLRRPLWFLLPEPHRSALASRLSSPPLSLSFVISAAVSIAVGACTHIIWDSFTHPWGWIVRQIPALHLPWSIAGIPLSGYSVLQHGSTLVGLFVIGVAYVRWLRRQPRNEFRGGGDGWRYLLAISAGIVSLAVAIPLALDVAAVEGGPHDSLKVFIVQAVIYSTSAFAALILVTSLFAQCVIRLHRKE
jgi:hypothetical protein